ncbi:hypothetical protein HND25_05935 [Rhodococcus erythropolis]|uniref:hypothetical protein n=1 Tax=Rhodococcus erythropolis TaxID=1833 RepID=UPI000A5C2CDE|nr:hypothetical protein [Rhodococcus erythropolis]MBO8145552.1 hypothetical protein [Rhodococcus erythropolis]MDO1488157.1 hypothetical protein [Rhodococcus erythropolis]GCB58236.1 hypothetical protein rerp_46440 [Rhodococcus erythropolis]
MGFTTLRDRVAEPLFAVFIATGLLLSVLITFTATGLAVGLLAAALLYVRNYSLTRTN